MPQTTATPARILGLYDGPFWDYMINSRQFRLQRCNACGAFRYPPGPTCHQCVSPAYEWTAVSGEAEILSWVVYHRGYLSQYPAPYNVIAVRLKEGPTMISNLVGTEPEGAWIGSKVRAVLQDMDDGVVLPRFELA